MWSSQKRDAVPRHRQRREHGRQPAVNLEVDDAVRAEASEQSVTQRRPEERERAARVDDPIFVEHAEQLGERLHRRRRDEDHSDVRVRSAESEQHRHARARRLPPPSIFTHTTSSPTVSSWFRRSRFPRSIVAGRSTAIAAPPT